MLAATKVEMPINLFLVKLTFESVSLSLECFGIDKFLKIQLPNMGDYSCHVTSNLYVGGYWHDCRYLILYESLS